MTISGSHLTKFIALIMFLLPARIMDGILVGRALVLILLQYFGDKQIVVERGVQ